MIYEYWIDFFLLLYLLKTEPSAEQEIVLAPMTAVDKRFY